MINPPIIPGCYSSIQGIYVFIRILTVTVTTVATANELLRGDQLVEGIELYVFGSDRQVLNNRKQQGEPLLE